MSDNNISKNQIWLGIFLVGLFIAGYTAADIFIISKGDIDVTNQEIKETVDNIEEYISPYKQKDSFEKQIIVTNFSNSVTNNEPEKTIKKTILTEGNISKAFLYVVASVDAVKLDEYSDIYIVIGGYIDDTWIESGGHLIENRSLKTPKSQERTEMLFNLSDVKYKENFGDSNIDVVSANWLSIINSSNIEFVTAFSSTEKQGLIEEISIFYECVEGTTCSLKIGN